MRFRKRRAPAYRGTIALTEGGTRLLARSATRTPDLASLLVDGESKDAEAETCLLADQVHLGDLASHPVEGTRGQV